MGKTEWKIKEIKSLHQLIRFLKENKDEAQKLLLAAAVILTMLCFWIFGGEDGTVPLEDTETVTEGELQGELDASQIDSISGDSIYVDIGGDVAIPGVYCISPGTRLFQVIELAGGLNETADIDSINRAEPVLDGQKIIIGSLDETSPYFTGTASSGSGTSASVSSGSMAGTGAVRVTADGIKVNINLAELEELQMIPGVGPSTAQKILDYRNSNGVFQKISDIKNIAGIGDKTYENLKDYIEV